MHIEAIEHRRLTASTGFDPTFGDYGTVTLPGVTLGNAVVSFPGGLFVEAVSAKNGKGFLYKLTPTGKIDTTFGDGGRIATPNFGIDVLAYDKRYNLLYAAGTTTRRVTKLRVERFDAATGQVDFGFGDGLGVASLAYGELNANTPVEITVGRLLPLPKRGLAVAFETVHGEEAVTVAKYTAGGKLDPSFATGGVGVVATGWASSVTTPYTPENPSRILGKFNSVAFADLQARTDGSLRVITSRRRGTSDENPLGPEGPEPDVVNATHYVRSQVFDLSGRLDAAQDRSWRVATITPADVVFPMSGDFIHQLVRADGDDGAVFIGTRFTADGGTAARAVTLTPAGRTSSRLLVPADRYFTSVVPYSRGYYAVDDDYTEVRASKLKSDFHLTPSYNDGAETITPVVYHYDDTDFNVVADIDGNLLALHVNQISRISG